MAAQEAVLRQRPLLLSVLCGGGSAELLEQVLDLLLAQGALLWEDYHHVQVPGRALPTNARQLLDLVSVKGDAACRVLLDALGQVLTREQAASLSLPARRLSPEQTEEIPGSSLQALLSRRAELVDRLRGSIRGALDVLVESGYFSSADCEDVQLPVYTPAQQARRLLNHVKSKGESAAAVLLQYVEQTQVSWPKLEQEGWNLPEELLRYQRKLRSSVSAQSCFLSTYGGTGHMPLDEVYTESRLEAAQDSAALSLGDIVGAAGSENTEADTVLVSGEAGSGKSTVLQRLHQLWARSHALQRLLLVFPLSCRRLNSEREELTVQELLFQHCCWPDAGSEQVFQFILDHPRSVLITFDGLDELKLSFSDERRVCCPTQRAPVYVLLFNLLQGALMKGVHKVVTSRPEAVGPALKKYLRKEVLLKGFSPCGIDSFVRKHHRDPAVASRVLESLRTNSALLGLCHSPALCWIVSQCHAELLGSGRGSPRTITDVYLMILEHFLRHQRPTQEKTGSGWLRQRLDSVLHLGQLAFEGVQTSCYIFSGTELEACGVTEQDICTGFLTHSRDVSSTCCERYEFLHVILQCFFAALFVVLKDSVDQSVVSLLFQLEDTRETPGRRSSCLKFCVTSRPQERSLQGGASLAETPNSHIVATFLSGLLSQRHRGLWLHCCSTSAVGRKVRQVVRCLSSGMQRHFRSIPKPVAGEKKSMHAMPDFVWLIKCIYEMQEDKVAKEIMSKLEVDHLKLTYCHVGPVECSALAYVLQHLTKPIGLQLDHNWVGDVGVEQLLPCLHVCKALYLRNNNVSDAGIPKLVAKGVKCENFQKIALFDNKLTDASMQHFSHLLRTKQNFLALRLGNNGVTAQGAETLAEGLKLNRSLQYLGLWGNKVGDAGAEALARALEGSKSLIWLSLVGNGVGSVGACALANVIKSCETLEELWLTENCISRTGVERLIQALQRSTRVKSVWLKKNQLSTEEMEELQRQEPRLVF